MNPRKILLVDDSSTALMINCMIIADHTAHEVITAKDGVEAVALAVSTLPDLIVMDVVMPRMTGLEACKELRSREATRKIPIVLVTSRGEEQAVENGYLSGCSDYLTKPVNPEELIALVESYLGECPKTPQAQPQK
jgi:CheY-like chemotaxis protein